MPLLKVEGKSEYGIFFGDEEREISVPLNSLVYAYAISNTLMIGPTFDMCLLDSTGSILTPTPSDGMKLRFIAGDSINEPTSYKFRTQGSPQRRPTPQGPGVLVNSIYDSVKLFHGVCKESVVGTSSYAIARLALDCGLQHHVDSSDNDSMRWLPMGRKYGDFLADIASHGWFGDRSAASVVAVTLNGEVRYRDLGKLAREKPRYSFYVGVDMPKAALRSYTAYTMGWEDKSTLGVGQFGYSANRTHFQISGDVQRHDGINVTQNNERINVSSGIREEVGISRVMLGAPDCGNTHEHYDQSEYQNLRYRGLYSRQLSVVCSRATNGPDLLDSAIVYYLDPKTREPKSTVGVISAKTVGIVNGFYVERFNIAYQGEDSDVING